MKKSLKEELERIHTLSYGKEIVVENNFLSNLFDKIHDKFFDDPKKANYVTDDVTKFMNNLEMAKQSGGLSQQPHGSMEYQKSVESMQIGLILLGYQLPKYGVDGLFGPETAQAVEKFKNDNQILNESASDIRTKLSSLGYGEKNHELSSGGDVSNNLSSIVDNILDDFKKAMPNVKVIVTSGNDNFHKNLNYNSAHTTGNALDLTLIPYNSQVDTTFKNILSTYKGSNPNFSFIDEYTNPSGSATAGHFHLQYNDRSASPLLNQSGGATATPQMLDKMIMLLKQRGVKKEDLDNYIDRPTSNNESVPNDLRNNFKMDNSEDYKQYADVCQKIINSRNPNAGITGEMMASGAKVAYEKYHQLVPPLLALAQLVQEGGLSKNQNDKPIRTNNPFNVGNLDNGKTTGFASKQDGINAYYELIAKNYLSQGKMPSDLLNNYVNTNNQRYASENNYESNLNNLINKFKNTLSGG